MRGKLAVSKWSYLVLTSIWVAIAVAGSTDTPAAGPRFQLFALAYNLANFLRRLALPNEVKHWSLTTLREKLVKIGAKVTKIVVARGKLRVQ